MARLNFNYPKNFFKMQYYYGIVYICIVFIAINIISFSWLNTINYDATEEERFTISEHSIRLLKKIPERIDLRVYFSEAIFTQMPTLKNYAERIQDFLSQLELHSDGKLNIITNIIQPFSPEEEEALAMGLQPIPLKNGGSIFMGIIAENMVDGEGIIPLLNPEDEALIEYDIARLIQGVVKMDHIKLGIASSLPLETGSGGQNGVINGTSEPYYIFKALQRKFELVGLSSTYKELLDEKTRPKAVLLLHPSSLNNTARQNLLHYLSTGGRALIAIDPYSEAIPPAVGSNLIKPEISSNMPVVLKALGLNYNNEYIILDRQNAREITNPQTGVSERYYELLALNKQSFDNNHQIMSSVKNLSFSTVGHLDIIDPTQHHLAYTPLIQSQSKVDFMKRSDINKIQYRQFLEQNYQEKLPYNLALAVSGQLDFLLKGSDPELKQKTTVIVIADSDFLDDRMWLQKGKTKADIKAFADNLDFLLNSVDFLTGDNSLIALRGKKKSYRPLVYLEDIKKDAHHKLMEKEGEIKRKIKTLRMKIQKLQQEHSFSKEGKGVLPEKINLAIQKFSSDLGTLRSQLREVRKEMSESIKNAENSVKIINVILMPILFSLISISILLFRRFKTRHQNRQTYLSISGVRK